MIKALPHHVVAMGVAPAALPAEAPSPRRNWCATCIIALVWLSSALSVCYLVLLLIGTAPHPSLPFAYGTAFLSVLFAHDLSWVFFTGALLGIASRREQASFAVLILTPAHLISTAWLIYYAVRTWLPLLLLPALDAPFWLLLAHAARNPTEPSSALWLPVFM